ncbi:MAG: short-chain dehydrogenase [Rhodospirillales bacterium RIFCSPLOWO2_01_FULL_65_14]|nr:MAG: short-chain dehydrogenase [Rhodospirillales bacterium RIFCSPLOWO2_01_FULL_65_14]
MPTVLITGASRGLGLEFARQYAADGWRVIAACREPKKSRALCALNGDIAVERLDIDDPASIGTLAKKYARAAIDVLINNAGIYGPRKFTMRTVDYPAWEKVLRTNTMAPLRVAAAFLPQVARGKKKTIATVSSWMGSIAGNDTGGAYIYRSSKAAVNMVMKSLAVDLKGKGIVVAVLHPGWVRTDMGGPNAAIEARESVAGMRAVIAKLKKRDTGKFFDYDGKPMAW